MPVPIKFTAHQCALIVIFMASTSYATILMKSCFASSMRGPAVDDQEQQEEEDENEDRHSQHDP